MQKTKKVKLDTHKDFNVRCETFNKDNPKSIFVNISSWLTPTTDEDMNYKMIVRNLRKKIKQIIYNNVDDGLFHASRTIVDLNLKESGIQYNKKSFMECEVTLYQKENHLIDDILPTIDQLTNLIIENSFISNEYFEFNRKK